MVSSMIRYARQKDGQPSVGLRFRLQSQLAWIQIPVPPLPHFVILGKLLNLSVSQFLHLHNGGNNV